MMMTTVATVLADLQLMRLDSTYAGTCHLCRSSASLIEKLLSSLLQTEQEENDSEDTD